MVEQKSIVVLGSTITQERFQSENDLSQKVENILLSGSEGDVRVLGTFIYLNKSSRCRLLLSGKESDDMLYALTNLYGKAIPDEVVLEQEKYSDTTKENFSRVPEPQVDVVITNLYHLPRVRFLAKTEGLVVNSIISCEQIISTTKIDDIPVDNLVSNRIRTYRNPWYRELLKLKEFSPEFANYYLGTYTDFLNDKISLPELFDSFN